jgi:signal transduction histidine kinase
MRILRGLAALSPDSPGSKPVGEGLAPWGSVAWKRRTFVLLAVLGLAFQLLGLYVELSQLSISQTAGIRAMELGLVVTQTAEEVGEQGIQVGDQIHALNGRIVGSILEYRETLNEIGLGKDVRVMVIRGGETVTLPSVRTERLDIGLMPLFLRHLAALCFLAVAIWVALAHPSLRAAQLFFLTATGLALYYALLDVHNHTLIYLHSIVVAFTPAFAIRFFLTFPKDRLAAMPRGRRWWPLFYLPSGILAVLIMLAYQRAVAAGTGLYYAPEYHFWGSRIAFGFLSLSGVFGLVLIGHTYFTIEDARVRRQMQWIMWGLMLASLAAAVDFALTVLQSHTLLSESLLQLVIVPLPLAFAFAILRYRLWDIDLVLSRSVAYALLTGVLAAVYLLLIALLSNALGIVAGSEHYTVVLFLSALAIGILFHPLRARIQVVLDRVFFRSTVDHQRVLAAWSEQLSTSLRFSDLVQLLLVEVPEKLKLKRAWLLVLDNEETVLRPIPWPEDSGTQHGPAGPDLPPGRSKHAISMPDGQRIGLGEYLSAEDKDGDVALSIPARSSLAVDLARPGQVFLLGPAEPVDGLSAPGVEARPTMQHDARTGPALWRGAEVLSTWQERDVEAALPLMSGGTLVGIYLLGAKLSGDVYQRQELELLRTLSNQAAVAIANARLYEEVHAFSQEMESKVRDRTKELRDFVSVVYHELSTPITSIRGFTDVLLEGTPGPLSERQTRYLSTVQRNVKRLMGLVGDLSDISKIDDGRLRIHPERTDLREVVDETLVSLSAIIEDKGLRVHTALDEDAVSVVADPRRIVQILSNLVSNACRYTSAGGEVVIRATRADGAVEVSVSDTGIGIPKEEIEWIFERFYRSPVPMVQEQMGTGLGLAITRSLVEMHGSQLWVTSTVGKGSIFGFSLRLADSLAQDVSTTDLGTGDANAQRAKAPLCADPGVVEPEIRRDGL